MDTVKKRIYISAFALLAAIIFAVVFIISRPMLELPAAPEPQATTSAPITYASNDSSYTVIAQRYTLPWDSSCEGLGHGRKIDPIISIQYPQIQGLVNKNLEDIINLFFETEFLITPLQRTQATCGTPEDPQFFENTGLDLSFDIKLQTDNYLSLKFTEATALLSGLRPIITYAGYTLDTTAGTILTYRDLFKADAASRQEIKKLVIAGLPKDVKSNPDIDRDILDYDFYLTKNEIVFFNIFLSHALRSTEVKIPFEKVKPYMVTAIN
jgi:hypothetical protein